MVLPQLNLALFTSELQISTEQFMKRYIHQLLLFIVSLGIAFMLSSCSGGSGDDNTASTSGGTGNVGILLTDKPADPSLFVAINASIESVELLGSDDGSRITLYSGNTKTFDLLRLRHEAIPFTFQDGVPTGHYCKIRLKLSDLELVLTDQTPDDLTDNETFHPKLPGNGKLDLVARDCFDVGAGEIVTLQLDIDAGNSIHVVQNAKGFNFRPVVFVDVLSQSFESKLVRLSGEITEINKTSNTILLCDAIPTQQMDSMGCVTIHLGDNAAYFDNIDYAGSSRSIDELLSDDKLGKHVTVVGWPQYWVTPYVQFDIPDGQLPPPGECKLWDINLEAGQQQPPGNCEEYSLNRSDVMILVDHNGVVNDPHHSLMSLDALTVELGDFMQVNGEVVTDADPTGFDIKVSSGGPVIISDTLGVMLQESYSGINGTRIVSKTGELLQHTDIISPTPVQIDGALEPIAGSDPLLKAALVILDKDTLGTTQVTGTVLTAGADAITLTPDANVICGMATTELLVNLITKTELLTVTITSSGSEIIPGGTLKVGQTVGMNGYCRLSGYETDNVVIIDDQTI